MENHYILLQKYLHIVRENSLHTIKEIHYRKSLYTYRLYMLQTITEYQFNKLERSRRIYTSRQLLELVETLSISRDQFLEMMLCAVFSLGTKLLGQQK